MMAILFLMLIGLVVFIVIEFGMQSQLPEASNDNKKNRYLLLVYFQYGTPNRGTDIGTVVPAASLSYVCAETFAHRETKETSSGETGCFAESRRFSEQASTQLAGECFYFSHKQELGNISYVQAFHVY